MVNSPLIRPYFLGGVALGGVARIPLIFCRPGPSRLDGHVSDRGSSRPNGPNGDRDIKVKGEGYSGVVGGG